MRVIAGTARSVRLDTPKGDSTRPTTDKIKETLFNILQFDVPGSVFVDLFSGSGAMGIEALSRGARKAVLVDNSSDSVLCIKGNLLRCHLDDKATVLRQDALLASSRMKSFQEDDTDTIFFLDPPYDQGLEYPVLKKLVNGGCVRGCDLIVIEKSLDPESMKQLEEVAGQLGLSIVREKTYKTQRHVFLRKTDNSANH